jgi:hypothetical protein
MLMVKSGLDFFMISGAQLYSWFDGGLLDRMDFRWVDSGWAGGFTFTTPTLNDGRSGSVFVRETRFSRDNYLGMEGVVNRC